MAPTATTKRNTLRGFAVTWLTVYSASPTPEGTSAAHAALVRRGEPPEARRRARIAARRSAEVQKLIRGWLAPLRFPQGVRVAVDIDPYSFV